VLGFADPCDGELHEVEKILTAEIAENGAESAEKIESSLWRFLVVLRVLGFTFSAISAVKSFLFGYAGFFVRGRATTRLRGLAIKSAGSILFADFQSLSRS
jgi:hypothetical protein